MSGTVGDLVFEQRAGGPVVKARRAAPPRRTAGQLESERRLALLSLAWHALDGASFAAWRRFAEGEAVRNPASGARVVPNPYNLFSKYAGKARQVDPSASLEGFRPPATPFGGDAVVITVSLPSGRGSGGVESLAEGGSTPSLPSPRGEGSLLAFSADRANAEGVVTELLAQPLVNARRRVYGDRYVSRGFVAFDGPGTVEAPCEAGAHALAYRFVRAATGQETALFELGVVEVGA